MTMLKSSQVLKQADTFILKNGRLLENLLFATCFKSESADPVVNALLAYQNEDGGFGNGLEPDIRDPNSQTVPTQFALTLLDRINRFDPAIVGPACDFLQTVTTTEGGVPWLLPSALQYPRSPWWQIDEEAASLNPTAEIVGLLHKNRVEHPWLVQAESYCWREIDRLEPTEMHEVGCVLTFLTYNLDQNRAKPILINLIEAIMENGLVAELDSAGYLRKPLDWAPNPSSPVASYLNPQTIEANLKQIMDAQQDDGGWPLPFPALSPPVEGAWRSWLTIEKLETLLAYGKLAPDNTEE